MNAKTMRSRFKYGQESMCQREVGITTARKKSFNVNNSLFGPSTGSYLSASRRATSGVLVPRGRALPMSTDACRMGGGAQFLKSARAEGHALEKLHPEPWLSPGRLHPANAGRHLSAPGRLTTAWHMMCCYSIDRGNSCRVDVNSHPTRRTAHNAVWHEGEEPCESNTCSHSSRAL